MQAGKQVLPIMMLNRLILGRRDRNEVTRHVSPDPRCPAIRKGLSFLPTWGFREAEYRLSTPSAQLWICYGGVQGNIT